MTEAIDILNSHNIRPSVQRIAILKYLLEHRIHPTVDDIYLALNPTMPTLSKTTVYNVLRNLVENGAVLALTIDEKNVRYDADISLHAHFRCQSCGELYDLKQPSMSDENIPGFEIENVHVYYWGKCPKCMNKK
ncbi:MAG: transcriptional repressor [Paludibacteraceae bacterium]|nr:transcriptional repressor [Paludibacteraceae bacterium]